MEKNKTGKYLKYAVGEIVLVVIGILIALQINNLNEQRNEKIKEQTLLIQLREDYQSNLLQLDGKIEMRNIVIFNALKILNIIDNPKKSNRDSLITYLQTIRLDPTFDPIQNDLNSSGSIRLIRNKKLKSSLSNWTSDIVAVKEMENLWSEIVLLQMRPIYASLGITRDLEKDYWSQKNTEMIYLLDKKSFVKEMVIGKSKSGASLTEITNNRIIESLAANGISLNKITNLQSKALRDRIIEIINLIDSEIN
tara:strand:- start:1604 stop:2359 length:756 start_codon:yes stop_codon:yes gene_type:complete